MSTLYDLGQKIARIREAVDSLETRGVRNAALVVQAIENCNDIIRMINNATDESVKRGDTSDGRSNTDTPKQN